MTGNVIEYLIKTLKLLYIVLDICVIQCPLIGPVEPRRRPIGPPAPAPVPRKSSKKFHFQS